MKNFFAANGRVHEIRLDTVRKTGFGSGFAHFLANTVAGAELEIPVEYPLQQPEFLSYDDATRVASEQMENSRIGTKNQTMKKGQ